MATYVWYPPRRELDALYAEDDMAISADMQSELATRAFCTAIGRALVDRGVIQSSDIVKYLKDYQKDFVPMPLAAAEIQVVIEAVERW